MKKVGYFIIIIELLLCIRVNATDISFNFNCTNTTLNKGGTTKCEMSATIPANITINNFETDMTKDADLEISFDTAQGWSGNFSGKRLVLTNLSGVSGTTKIGSINVRVSETASFGNKDLSFNNVKFSSIEGSLYNSNNSSETIKVLSTDNTLKEIKVDDVAIAKFSSDTLTYNLTTDNDKVKIEAVANDSEAKINGNGEKNVKYGSNTYEIKVTSQSGAVRVYKLNITRNDNRNNDNTLRSLSIEGYNLVFDKNKLSYTINVPSTVEVVSIKSTLTDNKASYVDKYGNREVNLEYGENVVEIKVKAENEEIRTYTLNINREDNRSDKAFLTELNINGEEIDLKDDLFTYGITLRFKHNKTLIEAKTANGATIDYKDIPLDIGDNELIITVTSEKGTSNEYKIKIKRLTQEESKVSFENILVKDYELNFTKSITSYELKVKEEVEKLDITINPDDEEITKTIRGNNNLQNGSIVTINIKDDNGEYVYTIKIIKDVNKLILGFLTIDQICYIIFTVGTLLFLGALIYLLKKKKTK